MDPTVSAIGLRARLAHGDDIRLVDVRTAAEFETGHIPASYHVPLDALREHRDEFRHVDAHVVLVCQSGNRAALTDTCAMGNLLARLPYNHVRPATCGLSSASSPTTRHPRNHVTLLLGELGAWA